MSDEDRLAVSRVQAGETDAFELLVEKYRRKAYRLAYQVLRDQEEALDVAQEAFVRAFRSLPNFKGDAAFYTWLFRITMNLALDRKRQRATRTKAMGADDVPPEEWERTAVAPGLGPEDEAASAERRGRIGQALETLSEQHRAIIVLSDIEGLSYREIAGVLDIPLGTVMSRLHNARKRLREALGPGFLALLLALVLAGALAAPAWAQAPGWPPAPPGVGTPAPEPGAERVCVFVLVILASNERPELPRSRLTPTPPLRPPGEPLPEAASPTEQEPDDWSADEPTRGCGQRARLRPWVPRLRALFGYANYEPMSAFESTMPVGMAMRLALPGGRALELQPLAVRDAVVRMAIRIVRGPVTEIATVMDVPPRRPALIGGAPYGPGVLIIAIRSRVEP